MRQEFKPDHLFNAIIRQVSHVMQWMVWAVFVIGLAVICLSSLFMEVDRPASAGVGLGLLALLAVYHFPPMFFKFSGKAKVAAYVSVIPIVLGSLIFLGLGLSPPKQSGGLFIDPAQSTINVSSDPAATYYLVQISALSNGNLDVSTERNGPSGTSFARREINCAARTFRYTAEGGSLADLDTPSATAPMSVLIAGSISSEVADHICRL